MKAKVGKEITGKANPADEIERWPLDKLTPYARNSRTHSDEQVAQLAASIREWGWTTPVLVDEDGGIIAGHGRVLAARQLGMVEVPVVVARGWSDAKRRAYVIADNKLALNAGWDAEMLSLELGELGELGFDLDLTGFSGDEIKSFELPSFDPASEDDQGKLDELAPKFVTCPHCEREFDARKA
jgi:ParB-like chromosome segregation protein Spo0J